MILPAYRRMLQLAFTSAVVLTGANVHAEDWRDNLLLPGFAGKVIRGESLQDQPVLLQFWESWCRSCGQLMSEMDELSARFPSVRHLVVSTDDDPEDAARRLESHPLFPRHPDRFFHDPEERLAKRFEITAVPTVLVIDADGREQLRHVGHFNSSELNRLASLLAELDSSHSGSKR